MPDLELNTKVPNFSLPDQDGKERNLSDFRGKWLVLYFYPKDNTSGCTTEACDFTENMPDFTALSAEVVGVSPDSPRSHANFIAKHNLRVTLLSDPDNRVLPLFGAWGKKKMYGKEYEGVVRSTVLIDPEGRAVYHWPNVKVKGHVADVKAKLHELLG
ncbi:MAG: peroxiredoxin [Acidobacteria bacterium]|nr:peroxiredoxin [Acidobacteriota bacterium]